MIQRWMLVCAALTFGCVEKTETPAPSGAAQPATAKSAPKSADVVKSAPADSALQKALVGVWVLDLEALQQDPELAKLEPKARDQAFRVAAELMKGTTIRFDGDAKLSMTFGNNSQSGTWRITGATGETLTIEAKTSGQQGPKTELIKARVQGDRLRVTGTDGRSLDLVRDLGNAETRGLPPSLLPKTPASAQAPASANK
jgi:PBP1b-binding outer membrane lipoprotein LpoB